MDLKLTLNNHQKIKPVISQLYHFALTANMNVNNIHLSLKLNVTDLSKIINNQIKLIYAIANQQFSNETTKSTTGK